MIDFDFQIRFPEIDFAVVNSESRSLADDLQDFVQRQFKQALLRNRKVVTGETLQSFQKNTILDSPSRGIFIRRLMASPVVDFIDQGRKPGKMPPEKPMMKWFIELGIPRRKWFPIRLSIARKGIKPRKIKAEAMNNSIPYIQKRSIKAAQNIAKGIIK